MRDVSSIADDVLVTDKWLSAPQQRTWLNYMRVHLRLEYEMNRQLQAECGFSLADYTVMNALSDAPAKRLQLSQLATTIGWERSRLSHHLQRMATRGFVERAQSTTDGRATDAILTADGVKALRIAAPKHVAWVRTLFFSELDASRTEELGDILGEVYATILREGTLPSPD